MVLDERRLGGGGGGGDGEKLARVTRTSAVDPRLAHGRARAWQRAEAADEALERRRPGVERVGRADVDEVVDAAVLLQDEDVEPSSARRRASRAASCGAPRGRRTARRPASTNSRSVVADEEVVRERDERRSSSGRAAARVDEDRGAVRARRGTRGVASVDVDAAPAARAPAAMRERDRTFAVRRSVEGRRRARRRSRREPERARPGRTPASIAVPIWRREGADRTRYILGAMPVRLYNTLTQKVEDFVPHDPGKVKLYVCGITTYDLAHAGHGRTYTTFDVLVALPPRPRLRGRPTAERHRRRRQDREPRARSAARSRSRSRSA